MGKMPTKKEEIAEQKQVRYTNTAATHNKFVFPNSTLLFLSLLFFCFFFNFFISLLFFKNCFHQDFTLTFAKSMKKATNRILSDQQKFK